MFFPPAVVVHGLDQMRVALRPGRPVTLLSARGAALYAGCGWWRALVAGAAQDILAAAPEAHDILDCADAPGHAMAALRIGQRALILDAACPAFAAVAAAAATIGAVVLADRPEALDLAERGAERHLVAWLDRDNAKRLG
jgi:hypothetical protein